MKQLAGKLFPLVPYLAILAFIAVVHYAIYNSRYELILASFVVSAVMLFSNWVLFNKKQLLFACVALIPLSVKTEIGGTGIAIGLPSEILIGLFAIIFLVKALMNPTIDKKVLTHPISIFLLIDTLWLIAASFFSTMPDISAKRVIVRICFILVFYLLFTTWFKDRKNIPRFFMLYAIGLAIVIWITLKGHARYGFISQVSFNISAPFYSDHTIYGACIAFLIPFFFIRFFNFKEIKFTNGQKLLLGFLLTLLVIGEIFSYSRAAWLSLMAIVLFYWLIRAHIKLWGLIGILAVLSGGVYFFSDQLLDSVKQNEALSNRGNFGEHFQSVTNIQTDASNLERINRWVCAIRMFEERPITGFGPGTYQFEYGQFQTVYSTTYISTFHGNKGNAHSEYLTYLSEAGLPGLVSFCLLILATFATGFRVIYRARDRITRKLGLAAFLGLATFFLHGLVNSFIDQDKMAILVFGSMAVLVALEVHHIPRKAIKD